MAAPELERPIFDAAILDLSLSAVKSKNIPSSFIR